MTAAKQITPHAGELVGAFGRFTITIVRDGDRFGRENCLVYRGAQPIVQFYDATHIRPGFTTAGQFVTEYNLSTLRQHSGGLDLLTYVPEWKVDAATFEAIRVAVERKLGGK